MPLEKEDASHQIEQTIILSKTEIDAVKKVGGKKVNKTRYYCKYKGKIAEFDAF